MVDAEFPKEQDPRSKSAVELDCSSDQAGGTIRSSFSPIMSIERAAVLYNPISGRGRSEETAAQLAQALDLVSVRATVAETKLVYSSDDLGRLFQGQDLVIIVGGDGSIMGCLGALAQSGTPVYMIPGGNESLFAKYFGMDSNPEKLIQAVRAGHVEDHFYGTVNGEPFFLMVSAGFDSLVIEEIGKRSGPSSDWLYISAALKVLPRFSPPEINLTVDGERVVNTEPGYIIIANTPSYGRNLKLVPEATSSNPTLAARFFPQGGFGRELDMAFRMSLGLPADLSNSRFYTGSRFELSIASGTFPMQADGEFVGNIGATPTAIQASSAPIRVLRPV